MIASKSASIPTMAQKPVAHSVAPKRAPSPFVSNQALLRLQRKCACGGKGDCPQCSSQKQINLQPKLIVGPADDPYEREADRIADQVVATSANPAVSGAPLRIQGFVGQSNDRLDAAPASVGHALAISGTPLNSALRQDMEQRYGQDFSQVRIQSGAAAEQSTRDVNANAYTVGHDIVFGAGRFAPETHEGRRLIAHELTHFVQQSELGARALQRAVMRLGALNVAIDYSGLPGVALADRADRIIAMTTSLTGAAPDAAQESAIRTLSDSTKLWLMFGLKLLTDNKTAAAALNMTVAAQRVLSHAPGAVNAPLPDPDRLFVREVLRVSGWSEVALAGRLSAPNAADTAAIREIVNPPPTTGSSLDPLDVAALNTRLRPALNHLLTLIDPGNWASVGTRSLSAFQRIGDTITEEARSFFSPYADTAVNNLFDIRPVWHASTTISDVGAIVPDTALRSSYLLNRAELVGRTSVPSALFIDTNIFADVHYDPTRAADRMELQSIVSSMESDPITQPIVNRLIQHTGRQSGSGAAAQIGLVTEFNASANSACKDHWSGVDTLCHEVLHALVHPNFRATAGGVSFPQVIREGFTEVLGVQLFNDRIVPKAASDVAFKASLEAGVSGAPCPAPALATIGYGDAGKGADSIRSKVHDDNFRAAYFLGRPELAGLLP